MHLKLTNGTPAKYTLGQLRRDNPQTSFPKLIPADLLASYDVYPYTRPVAPEYDSLTHRLTDGVFEQVEGAWVSPYVIEQQPLEQTEGNIRSRRDGRLEETDYIVVRAQEDIFRGNPNASPTQGWLDYRQALRDITEQAGFPYSVTWPVKPV